MGLLDDAIREHLELKRRHGADPGEVARQEEEVLGSPRTPAEAPPEATGAARAELPDDPLPPAPELREEAPAPPVPEGPAIRSPEAEATRVEHERSAPADLPPDEEDDADWSEPPSRAAAEPDVVPADEEADVLEETPDFLEETPEHDRLWFEQRPPRDFDF